MTYTVNALIEKLKQYNGNYKVKFNGNPNVEIWNPYDGTLYIDEIDESEIDDRK